MSVTLKGYSFGGFSLTPKRAVITLLYDVYTFSQGQPIQGNTETINVEARVDYGATLFYQWQRLINGTWTDIPGATLTQYTTPALVYADDNGASFRCYITANYGALPLVSSAFVLNMAEPSDTMTVANGSAGGVTLYGANDGTSYSLDQLAFNPYGSITGGKISYATYYRPTGQDGFTYIEFKPGTYNGYTVDSNGAIDGDLPSHIRWIHIGNGPLVFNYVGPYYQAVGDDVNLFNAVGTTIPLFYDPDDNTTVYDGNTILPATLPSSYNATKYGANADTSERVFGQVRSSYIKQLYYINGGNTYIKLTDGTYTLNSNNVVVSNGAIASDANGSTRIFTIAGTQRTLFFDSSSGKYTVGGDPVSLYQNLQSGGSAVTIVYDPGVQPAPAGGGGGGANTTSVTIYNSVGFWNDGQNPYKLILYVSSSNTTGIAAMDAVPANATITITDNNSTPPTTQVTLSGSFTKTGPVGPSLYEYMAILTTANPDGSSYQQISTVDVPTGGGANTGGGTGGGGSGGGTTYTAGTDYSASPPAVSIFGGPTYYTFSLYSNLWTNSAGANALLGLTTGGTFNVNISGTSYTLTLENVWSGSDVVVSSSPSLGNIGTTMPSSITTSPPAGGTFTYNLNTHYDYGGAAFNTNFGPRIIVISQNLWQPVPYTNIKSLTSGKTVSLQYNGLTYIGTTTRSWSEDSPGNWSIGVDWTQVPQPTFGGFPSFDSITFTL